MKRGLFLVMWCYSLAFASASDQQGKYTALILPYNVTLGMTRDAIQSARPEAKKLDVSLSSRRANAVVLTELKQDAAPATCYQYHLVDNQLCAVTMGILHAGNRDEQLVKHFHETIAKDLVKQADEKIIRLDEKMQRVLVTAELWKDEKNGTRLYFVDTSKDTTIITFDPKFFGKNDFFVSADQAPDITPVLETMRKQIDELKKLKK